MPNCILYTYPYIYKLMKLSPLINEFSFFNKNISENCKRSKYRWLTMGWSGLYNKSTTQPQHLNLRNDYGRGSRGTVKSDRPGMVYVLWDVSLYRTWKLQSGKLNLKLTTPMVMPTWMGKFQQEFTPRRRTIVNEWMLKE